MYCRRAGLRVERLHGRLCDPRQSSEFARHQLILVDKPFPL
jgi:hypothetical protein